MSQIRMLNQYVQQVKMGTKSSTIRDGHRDIHCGPLVIETTETGARLTVMVSSVKHTYLNLLTDYDAQRDGFADLAALRSALHQLYVPDRYATLPDNLPITIIVFE